MTVSALIIFAIINSMNYLDRYLLPAILPKLIPQFSLSESEAGILVSAFVFGYVIFSPIFGFFGDRFNRPKLMAIGVALWTLATCFTAAADGFLSLLIARIFVGVGEASFVAIAPGYFKDRLSDEAALQRALSVFFAAVPVGAALSYASGGAIADSYGWRAAFLALGIPGILGALYVGRQPEARRAPTPQSSLRAGVGELLKNKLYMLAVLGYVLNSFALSGVAAFITEYGVKKGFSLSAVGVFFGVVLLAAGGGGTILGGRIADRLSRGTTNRVRFMFGYVALSAMIAAPLLYFAFTAESPMAFLVCCALAELAVFLGTGPLNAIIVIASPPQLLALSQGMSIFLINLFGSLPSPYLVGLTAERGLLSEALRLMSLPLLASSMVWICGWRASRGLDRNKEIASV